jgi:hypothetical protein
MHYCYLLAVYCNVEISLWSHLFTCSFIYISRYEFEHFTEGIIIHYSGAQIMLKLVNGVAPSTWLCPFDNAPSIP